MSLIQPLGFQASSCGYCSTEKGKRSKTKSSRTYGMWAHELDPAMYERLLLQGWRRSGKYLYRVCQDSTCCVQHTIALKAAEFKPSKSQKQLLHRFTRFVAEGGKDGAPGFGAPAAAHGGTPAAPAVAERSKKGKEKALEYPVDLEGKVHQGEWSEGSTFKHKFEFKLEEAAFTEEKFELYSRYQQKVHNESAPTAKGFKGFLCNSPFTSSAEPQLGAKHGMYYLDGKLIAIAVLDVLPKSLSSVYLIWDPDWAGLGLGKVSALREIAMTREMDMEYYLMGFYIHTCAKMRYKADYAPSFLLDPPTSVFYPYETCKAILDANSHSYFSTPSTTFPRRPEIAEPQAPPAEDVTGEKNGGSEKEAESSSDDEDEDEIELAEPPPGFLRRSEISTTTLDGIAVLSEKQRRISLFANSPVRHDSKLENKLRGVVAAVGLELSSEIIFYLS